MDIKTLKDLPLFKVNYKTFHPKEVQDLPVGPLKRIKNQDFFLDTVKFGCIVKKSECKNKKELKNDIQK